MKKSCVNCGDSNREFQNDTSICKECFYILFKDIYPDLVPPPTLDPREIDFEDKVLIEYKPWNKRKEKELRLHFDGKWAKRYAHLLGPNL